MQEGDLFLAIPRTIMMSTETANDSALGRSLACYPNAHLLLLCWGMVVIHWSDIYLLRAPHSRTKMKRDEIYQLHQLLQTHIKW